MSGRWVAFAALLGLGGCGGETPAGSPAPKAPQRIKLQSTAFSNGERIPKLYTCKGKGVQPPLRWSGLPRGTQSLALLVEDPDAPNGTFVHLTEWDIPPSSKGLPPGEITQGTNGAGNAGWIAPCPPSGSHRYVFTLYALSKPLGLRSGADAVAVHKALRGKAIARGQLIGRFGG